MTTFQRSFIKEDGGRGLDKATAEAAIGAKLPSFLPRELFSTVRAAVVRCWPVANPKCALKRELALLLLEDPDMRLRVTHLEDLLNARLPPMARHHIPPLQAALTDAAYSKLFMLDAAVTDPDWGMQVVWLNLQELQREIGLNLYANGQQQSGNVYSSAQQQLNATAQGLLSSSLGGLSLSMGGSSTGSVHGGSSGGGAQGLGASSLSASASTSNVAHLESGLDAGSGKGEGPEVSAHRVASGLNLGFGLAGQRSAGGVSPAAMLGSSPTGTAGTRMGPALQMQQHMQQHMQPGAAMAMQTYGVDHTHSSGLWAMNGMGLHTGGLLTGTGTGGVGVGVGVGFSVGSAGSSRGIWGPAGLTTADNLNLRSTSATNGASGGPFSHSSSGQELNLGRSPPSLPGLTLGGFGSAWGTPSASSSVASAQNVSGPGDAAAAVVGAGGAIRYNHSFASGGAATGGAGASAVGSGAAGAGSESDSFFSVSPLVDIPAPVARPEVPKEVANCWAGASSAGAAPESHAGPPDYASWQSSSPEVSSMRSGDEGWPRLSTRKAPEGAGSTGPSPSVSEEGEEMTSQGTALEMESALEAIIGFEGAGTGSTGTPVAADHHHHHHHQHTPAQAAAANNNGKPAGAIAAAAHAGGRPPLPGGTKSFAAVAVASGGAPAAAPAAAAPRAPAAGSKHSSMDSAADVPGAGAGLNNANNNTLLTGYAAMAAREPGKGGMAPGSAAAVVATAAPQAAPAPAVTPAVAAAPVSRPAAATAAAAAAPAATTLAARMQGSAAKPDSKLFSKLSARVKEEIYSLCKTVPGLKLEDFDDGVLYQLTLKKGDDEAVNALRTLASDDVTNIQHMAAYINHVIKNYHMGPAGAAAGSTAGATASLPSATVRANSTPVSSKAILQKLPLRVYKRLEDVIAKCSYMEWKHFDAGVIKVMAQLAEISEEDVFEEMELLMSTDLSNVEYMPAYLNKRLNNRLWSRRKMAAMSGSH